MDIWQQCAGERQVRPLRGKLLRMVESQAQVATSQLVDNLAEQALLEDLLENSKPPLPEAAAPPAEAAVTVALRGVSNMSAISPNPFPLPSVTALAPPRSNVTRTLPFSTTWYVSPVSPSHAPATILWPVPILCPSPRRLNSGIKVRKTCSQKVLCAAN